MEHMKSMSREDLMKLIEVHALNWLAHDGCWFLAAEDQYGLDSAIELDRRSWDRFSPAEARRIMQAFDVPAGGGLDALEKALRYRLYATVNKQTAERTSPGKLIFKMVECRVQSTRRRKGLPDFPCKSVGIVEYSRFAETVDPRIKTRCLNCPPDKPDQADCVCAWEFTV
jgi:hypothetical protein